MSINRSFFIPFVLAAGLSACDSDTLVTVVPAGEINNNTDNQPSNSSNGDVSFSSNRAISQVGLIKVEPVNSDTDFTRGIFTELDTSLTAKEVLEFFVPADDFCEVTRYNAAFPPGPAFRIYEQQPTQISAGDTVTLTSRSGTYATLERQVEQPFGLIYRSNSNLSSNIPDGLVLNIPGEVFPGFANVAVSDVPALRVNTPSANQQLTANTRFSWNANGDPLSVFEIYAGYTSPETNEVTEIGCTVIDDGNFSFDAATRQALGEGYTADWFSVLRVVYDVAETEDAMLFIANSID